MIAFDPETHCYPRVPSFWIFDEKRRGAGPVTIPGYGALAVHRYDWSLDNLAEIAKGWIAKGNTVREAAAAAGIDDPDCAQESVAAYNSLCTQTKPDPFGRPAETMVPLDCPPYYCLPLWPGGTNTSGGLRRDERGRIMHAFGHLLPGLFGAGDVA
jgi:succinate dehydrogenase/fumarate reductase flavoprotein subunit